MNSNGSGGSGASRVEHMVAALAMHGKTLALDAFADGEHVLTREAPDVQEGLVMLSAALAELGRDGWRIDAITDTGRDAQAVFPKAVFLSRDSSW